MLKKETTLIRILEERFPKCKELICSFPTALAIKFINLASRFGLRVKITKERWPSG